MSWKDFKNQYSSGEVTPIATSPVEALNIDSGASLKVNDLVNNYQYLNPIREYMVERKGVDYKDMNAEEVVDDFVQHMRYFNANAVSTAGEVRFISKADQMRKDKAAQAYKIYDALGNVFVNDGVMGAVSGIGDYVFAAAKDPTNYLGLVTGGIGRAGAAGVQLTGKQVVKQAVKNAALEAAQSGAGRQASKEAAERAGIEAARRAVEQGMSTKVAGGVYQDVYKRVAKEGRVGLAKNAAKAKQKELFELAGTRALKQTIALDAGAAVLQDVMAQQTYLEAGAQEQYSALQTTFSSLLGGVAGAAQLGFGKFRGASGLEDTGDALEKIANAAIADNMPVFSPTEAKDAALETIKNVKAWNAKVEAGAKFGENPSNAELVKMVMLGEDGKGGLAKVFADKGLKPGREKHVSDLMTNVVKFMPAEDLAEINKEMAKYTGVNVGELAATRVQLGDMIAKQVNEWGKGLNVMSQVSKTLNAGVAAAQEKMELTLKNIDAKEELGKELAAAKKSDKYRYGQSVWKRLLVSSPATTALNVAGYTQFAVGQTMADLFNSTSLMVIGARQRVMGNREGAAETFRQARAYSAIIAQRARNLVDPYTTHDAYMKFLDENNDVQKVLFETMAGGVDASAARFGIDPNNKVFRNIEALTTAANQITGVRIQDSFTKSQMFMGELDKYLRINKNMTLKEALINDEAIDDTVLQGALDTTLKSVFAKDYTTADQGELIRTTAKFVETVSNTPVLGTILPFGRFMNNVVATAYQWSPFAAMSLIKPFGRKILQDEGMDVAEREILARWFVGSSALLMAAEYDKPRREQGLGVFDVDVGGGTIVDAKNTYPFSLFLAAGRVYNMKRNGEEVPAELLQELGTQLAVGQLARDMQFGNDLNNILDVLVNADEDARGASLDAFAKVAGNFASGFTRPLDAINKTIGFAMGTDGAKDVRQASGANVFTQSATKYVDNILEAFIDKTDAITGEDLKVATREGEIYDANPFARIFGITIKPGRTATEKAYSMSEMFPWTASERTNMAAYDRAFNGLLAPVLERQTQYLINTPEFKNGDLTDRRQMLKNLMSDVKRELRSEMQEGYQGGENYRLRLVAKAKNKGNKEVRNKAMRMMKDQYGITGSLDDMNYQELDIFMDYMEYLKEIYEELETI
jgi:hypothetical protein